jgi:hypothetical protein
MSIAVVNNSFVVAGATSSIILGVPSGTASGQLMLAFLTWEGPWTVTPPSGGTWALLSLPGGQTNPYGYNIGEEGMNTAVYYRYAGASEPASYTWNFSNTAYPVGGIVTLSGTIASGPLDTSSQNNASSAAPTALSITTAAAGNYLFAWYGTTVSGSTLTPPAGYTVLWNQPYVASVNFGSVLLGKVLGGAGATGNAVASPNLDFVAWQLAILSARVARVRSGDDHNVTGN